MEKRLTMILACLFLSLGMALAQTQVTGTVVSQEDGQPIIGASIKVQGTNLGTVTDSNGSFSITVTSSAKLVISYIGCKTAVVTAKPRMRITLQSDEHVLDELVVTGYGTAKKLGSIAGSVSTVGSEKFEGRPVANIGDALQGQVAGVQVFTSSGEPTAGVSIRLRGVTSINASTTPLFILDGSEITSNTFKALNPEDIATMTVLKDASATAIYGSRAANGVIILTSKRGKFGEAPTVKVSAQYGISKSTGDHANMMNSSQWLDLSLMST
jgi:TonB-dependent SusC/RagA subfamily outer membrane receptor